MALHATDDWVRQLAAGGPFTTGVEHSFIVNVCSCLSIRLYMIVIFKPPGSSHTVTEFTSKSIMFFLNSSSSMSPWQNCVSHHILAACNILYRFALVLQWTVRFVCHCCIAYKGRHPFLYLLWDKFKTETFRFFMLPEFDIPDRRLSFSR